MIARTDGGRRGFERGASSASSANAERILSELEEHIERLLPGFSGAGAEAPARALLEAFATSLVRLDDEIESLPDRLLALVLAALGEDERWPEPARSALVLEAAPDLARAVRVPRGTGVTRSRRGGEGGERVSFETASDAWLSPARLVRAFTVEGDDVRELPLRAPGSELRREESYGDVPVFRRTELDRSILLGDDAWGILRDRASEVILEWPGAPASIAQGRWEYSVRGGWRLLPVDWDETTDPEGNRVLRMRILGPLPDLERQRIEGGRFPWLRLEVATERRFQFPPPRIVWAPGETMGRRAVGLPRVVARLASRAGARWEDHSFPATRRVTCARFDAESGPAVWLGWDRPLPASLFWSAGGASPPRGARDPVLRWEHSIEDGFGAFEPRDETRAFARSGVISWDVLEEWRASERFGERLYWVRARWTEGSYFDVPRVRSIYPSAVDVIEGRVLENVPLSISVAPGRRSAEVALPIEGEWAPFDAIEIATKAGEWERLERAPAGLAPIPSEFQIVRRPGGLREIELGRELAKDVRIRAVAVRTLTREPPAPDLELDVIEKEIEGLAGVRQVRPVRGGRRAESVRELAERAREEWRRGFRVVTREDYERLTRAFDPAVVRAAACVPPGRPGEVLVVVVGRPPFGPGRLGALRLEVLSERLAERAPLGTIVRVVEPAWIPLDLEVEVEVHSESEPGAPSSSRAENADAEVASSDAEMSQPLQETRARVERVLRTYFDPLDGGADGRGFPIGSVSGPRSCERLVLARFGSPGTDDANGAETERVDWGSELRLVRVSAFRAGERRAEAEALRRAETAEKAELSESTDRGDPNERDGLVEREKEAGLEPEHPASLPRIESLVVRLRTRGGIHESARS